MNKKWLPIVLILLMAVAIFAIKLLKGKDENAPRPKPSPTKPKDPSSEVNRDRGFDRRTSYIKYSKHAKCRMKCRYISQAEVEEIMQDGTINYRKSDLQDVRCPTYALEGTTKDNQRVRIVFAQCNESTTVVTVIDLENEFKCNCPGNDSPASSSFKNQVR